MSNLIPFQDLQGMAQAIAKSGLFGMKTPEQALALMLVAQAEGQHPASITQDYDIIQGRAVRKTHSVLARFQAAGGRVEWHRLDDEVADATFTHPQGGILRIKWTKEMANAITSIDKEGKQRRLTEKDNWKNYPRAMLRARCIAEGIRAVYPAALGGMMVSEEAQDLPSEPPKRIDAETGEIKPDARAELPPYQADRFASNLPQWQALVESGRKTPEDILAMLQSKATLTQEQIAAIRELGVTDVQPVEVAEEA